MGSIPTGGNCQAGRYKRSISYRHGAAEARRAHNPEDLGSKPSAGIFHFPYFIEMRMSLSRDKPILLHRHGAAEARRAHNPEDLGSKPSAGIFTKII